MRIIVDGMGGDNAPVEVVKGCVNASNNLGVNILLVGDSSKIEEELAKYDYIKEKIEILHSNDVITNHDDPTLAIRRKKDSSMVMAFNALKEGKGDGMLSAGNTGALLAGGLFIIKRIQGIDRAAIGTVYPTNKEIAILIDAGANVDSKPEYLRQFGIMGSIYMEHILGRDNPKVGLVSNGVEEGKGNKLVKETHSLLKEAPINFTGNVEARELPGGNIDVIVADGFVGNVIIKLTEGVASFLMEELKQAFGKNLKTKIGAVLLKNELKTLKGKMDYRQYGGAPLLGIQKEVVKAHGSSDAFAIENAIKQLVDYIDRDVIKIIGEKI